MRLCSKVHHMVLAAFTSCLFITITWRHWMDVSWFNMQSAVGTCRYVLCSFSVFVPFIDYGHCVSVFAVINCSWSYSSRIWEKIGLNLRTGWENLGRHRNNELNTPFLPTTTAVAVHLSVSTRVASRSTWQQGPLWQYYVPSSPFHRLSICSFLLSLSLSCFPIFPSVFHLLRTLQQHQLLLSIQQQPKARPVGPIWATAL